MTAVECVNPSKHDLQSHYSPLEIAGIKALRKSGVSSKFIKARERCANDSVKWTQICMVMQL